METSELKDNILELICRTCLKINKIRFNLYKHSQNDRFVSDMLMECLSIRIHKDDGLPDNICSNCINRLSSYYDFKTMAIQSDTKLHILYESKELENNINSIYIKEDKTREAILKSEQSSAVFHLIENVNLEKSAYDNLLEKPNVNNNIEDNTAIIFPKKESRIQDRICISNNTQLSNQNLISLALPTSSHNYDTSDGALINNYCENRYIHQTEPICSGNFKEKYVSSTNESNDFLDCKSEKPKEKLKRTKRRNQSEVLNTTDTTFNCDKCNRSFVREYFLKQHMRIHSESKEYSCDICVRTFRTLHGAQIHKTTHSDERPYKCNVCSKTFKYNDILKHHLLIHENYKKFVCELCGKTFINSAGLIHHKSTHNTEKSFVCTVCGKCFKSQPRLSDHLRRHSDNKPYVCHYCDSRFKCSNVLKSHVLIHTGAKPFSCAICDKKFRQRPSLRYHMRIHTGETPYECELCSSKFKYKQHLSNHMKVHKVESPKNHN